MLRLNAIGSSIQNKIPLISNSIRNLTSTTTSIAQTENSESDENVDDLYKRVLVKVRGHDPAVLESYRKFVEMTARELHVNLHEVREPHKFIERWTLLKSRFSNRKHMRQYEMRTYFKEFEFKHLTGSTCDTLLEYIQRNLPEGVAMDVHQTRLNALPEHFNGKAD
jgi:small subunit ribosomal protein S10